MPYSRTYVAPGGEQGMSDDHDTLEAVREQVLHLAAAFDHDDEPGMEDALDELGRLLDITDDDMEAFEEHYHAHHGHDDVGPVH